MVEPITPVFLLYIRSFYARVKKILEQMKSQKMQDLGRCAIMYLNTECLTDGI